MSPNSGSTAIPARLGVGLPSMKNVDGRYGCNSGAAVAVGTHDLIDVARRADRVKRSAREGGSRECQAREETIEIEIGRYLRRVCHSPGRRPRKFIDVPPR